MQKPVIVTEQEIEETKNRISACLTWIVIAGVIVASIVLLSIGTSIVLDNNYNRLDSTRANYYRQAAQVCGDEQFMKYNNCTMPFTLQAPTYDEKNNPELTRIKEECNILCQKAGNPTATMTDPALYFVIGGLFGLIPFGVILLCIGMTIGALFDLMIRKYHQYRPRHPI